MTIMMIGPALAALLALGGWMTAQTRDQNGLPRRGLVSLGQAIASLGLVVGVLAVPLNLPPHTYATALGVTLLVGLVLVRGAGRLAIGWTSTAEMLTSTVGLGWTRPRRAVVSLLVLAAGLTLAVWLAARGEPLAGPLGAAVILAPARWWMPWGAKRERIRTGVERAMAGALAGGTEWDSHEADLRGAPVRVRFTGDATPARITAPLPPGWKATSEENLSSEVNSRLSEWGTPWITSVDHSRRRIVATKGQPLPDFLPWNGTPARNHQVTLGMARVSPAGAAAGAGRLGEVKPFIWDLDDTPAGIIVGTAGGGKSVLVRLLVTQCAMAGWRVYLLDPKRVEMTPFSGRQNIVQVADTLPAMVQTSRALSAEVDRRYEALKHEGVQKNSELRNPFPPILCVVDEYFELVAKVPGSDDDVKAENEARSSIASDTRHGAACARAADVHYVLLAQRADAEVVKGSLQNNLRLRALMRPATAGATARSMIGMTEVQPSGNPRGRAVMMTDSWPESEVQVAYLDAADLDRYLPKNGNEPEPADGPVVSMEAAGNEAGSQAGQGPDREDKQRADRDHDEAESKDGHGSKSRDDQGDYADDNRDDSGDSIKPGSIRKPSQDRDSDKDDSEDGAGPDPSIDPLDFWEDG